MAEPGGPVGNGVQALLLKEAQEEIAGLRVEMYNYRRLAEERRQALDAVSHQRDMLGQRVQQAEDELRAAAQVMTDNKALQQSLSECRQMCQRVQKESQLSQEARKILEAELRDERAARLVAEEAKTKIEVDRSRIQKARDDAIGQLRLLQQKAREAEEEQYRAEEEAASLRRELQMVQGTQSTSRSKQDPVSSGPLDSYILVQQLEGERSRTTTLMNELTLTKAQLERYKADAMKMQLEVEKLRYELEHAGVSNNDQVVNELEECKRNILSLEKDLREERAINQQLRVSQDESAQLTGAAPSAGTTRVEQAVPGEDLYEELQLLQNKLVQYKRSRDKLLAEIDRQAAEVDRLMLDKRALAQDAEHYRGVATKWEAQAQDGLVYIGRLKDLLEESATWQVEGGQDSESAADAGLASFQKALLQEQARNVDLDLQVRALCAELTRSHIASRDLGQSMLPVLA